MPNRRLRSWVPTEHEERSEPRLPILGEETEVARRRGEIDPRAPEPGPDELPQEVVTKIVQADLLDGLVLDRVGRPLAHEAEQLVADQCPIGGTSADKQAPVARLDPSSLNRWDFDHCDLAAADYLMADLDP
jgi:hypothetical protein